MCVSEVHDESDSVWTAASDSITEGIWEWNWGNAIMEYTNWDEGQPGEVVIVVQVQQDLF